MRPSSRVGLRRTNAHSSSLASSGCDTHHGHDPRPGRRSAPSKMPTPDDPKEPRSRSSRGEPRWYRLCSRSPLQRMSPADLRHLSCARPRSPSAIHATNHQAHVATSSCYRTRRRSASPRTRRPQNSGNVTTAAARHASQAHTSECARRARHARPPRRPRVLATGSGTHFFTPRPYPPPPRRGTPSRGSNGGTRRSRVR